MFRLQLVQITRMYSYYIIVFVINLGPPVDTDYGSSMQQQRARTYARSDPSKQKKFKVDARTSSTVPIRFAGASGHIDASAFALNCVA